jgi:hypothetical protein
MFRNDLLNPSVAVVIWENQATRQGAAVGDAHHGPVSVSVAVRVNERAAADCQAERDIKRDRGIRTNGKLIVRWLAGPQITPPT